MAGSDFVFFQNVGLSDFDTGGQTSTVGEPSVANNGDQILLTGNWYTSRSLDGGGSWDFVSPFNFLPPVDNGFCCDQTTIYDPSRDITCWLLQYSRLNGTNTLRVAVKVGPNLGNNVWHWWDFRPGDVDINWADQWFDYNHAALSNNFLYVGTNMFRGNSFTRCVIFRLPLDELREGEDLTFEQFQTTDFGSLRCTQGARDVMYFAGHRSGDQLRVFRWPESSASVTPADVDVSSWTGGSYNAPGPDGNNWLDRADPRITGAWLASGLLGFMWSVNAQGARPHPHVRVVRIDEKTMNLVDEPDIWNSQFAYAYPEATPNDRGHVGITLFRGGGSLHPAHVVGLWDDFSNAWELHTTREGTDGPVDRKWGDYLACRRHSPDGLTWIATGFTLQGGASRGNIEPRFVHFGRRRDEGGVARWTTVT